MALNTADGRWGTECSVPVRLASVMAHLGSYEEILAHVFHTSVLSSTALPGESFRNTKRTSQEPPQQGRPSGTEGVRIFSKSNTRTRLLNNIDSRSL